MKYKVGDRARLNKWCFEYHHGTNVEDYREDYVGTISKSSFGNRGWYVDFDRPGYIPNGWSGCWFGEEFLDPEVPEEPATPEEIELALAKIKQLSEA